MKSLIYGNKPFSRDTIPDELRDLSTWPTVDITALSPEKQDDFKSRAEAIRIFIEAPYVSLASLKNVTGVHPQSLYRLLTRCLTQHADGRIYGFRAVLPFARLKEYERCQPPVSINGGIAGLSGAFTQLLQIYPSIEKFLKHSANERNKRITTAREVRKSLKRIHKGFLEECRKAGVKANEYPFTQSLLGIRSLATYLKKHAEATFVSASKNAGATRVSPGVSVLGMPTPSATRAYEIVEFDGHKIDLRITLRVKDPFGLETLLELHRIWILVLLDLATRAVIGYSIALGREYNKDDVAAALQAALTPYRRRDYMIPGLAVREGGGYPSAVLPQTEFACWEWFRFDGARSHLATDTLERLTKIVGCWTDNGPSGQPDARPFIERFFHLIARHFAHRLPGTMGSDPKSIEKLLSDPKSNLSLLVELSELEDMIDVLLADYNGEPHDGLGGRTPLEAMSYMVKKQDGFLRTLPNTMRPNLCLLQEARQLPIRGSLQSSIRPHVNFSGVRYSSDVLSNSASLLGQSLRVYFDVRDIRVLKAFFDDGSELGILTAARPWCYTPHSLRMRQEILRLKRLGKLNYREGDDPVEAWEKFKRIQSKSSKNAANDLAKFKYQDKKHGESVPLFNPLKEQLKKEKLSNDTDTDAQQNVQVEKVEDASPHPKPMRIKRTLTF
ncbi:hypothetical protein [Herminiimonas arsenitoxidans]|uniref:hypothetical protein n=1 Tax=Herminiimonas arsenitoxidans TaxID=1809410 RepID=UPI0009712518|nr:hypothetical protein [Herminiimonas arsenitoxidans]